MQRWLQVMISTRLFNSSMKLPTASLNFLSRRFCTTQGKPCAAGLSNRKLHRVEHHVSCTHTPVHGIYQVLRFVGIDLRALVANHNLVLFTHFEQNLTSQPPSKSCLPVRLSGDETTTASTQGHRTDGFGLKTEKAAGSRQGQQRLAP